MRFCGVCETSASRKIVPFSSLKRFVSARNCVFELNRVRLSWKRVELSGVELGGVLPSKDGRRLCRICGCRDRGRAVRVVQRATRDDVSG